MYIQPLSSPTEIGQAGAKAANLARAAQAGLWVPESFVLLRSALAQFLDAAQLRPAVRAALDAFASQAPGPANHLPQENDLQVAVQVFPIPAKIRAEVDPVVRKILSHSPAGLAVRSSAVNEDLPGASFAGVYATVLGVTDLEGFWQAVRAVWCSAWTAQAAAYLRKMSGASAAEAVEDGMAVLIQPLVAAECAGVVFSADPLSGNPWRFVLNAVPGLASAMVDGAAPADRFVLDWESGAILERRIASKPTLTAFAAGAVHGAVRKLPLPDQMKMVPSLSDEQARAVGQLALSVDRLFDQRMDLEWAFGGGMLFLLQARPLTGLPAFFPHELSAEDAAQTWTPYLNTFAPVNPRERLIAPFHRETWLLEQWSRFQTPDDYFPRREGQERDFNGYRYATAWRWYGKPTDWAAIEAWLDGSEAGLRGAWQEQLARARRENALADKRAAELAAREQATLSKDQEVRLAADWLRLTLHFRREEDRMQAAVWHAPQWLIFTCEELLGRFLKEALPERSPAELLSNLLQGLSCHSSERTAAARDLGRAITEEPVRTAFRDQPLSRVIPYLYENHPDAAFLADLQALCRAFGLLMPEPDGRKNPYAQDLDGVLLAVRGGVLGEGLDPRDVLAQAAARRTAFETGVEAGLSGQPEQAARFRKLLGWAQFWTPALDNRKWHTAVNARLGQLYRQTQAALVRAGLIDHPDTFYILTIRDWEDFCARRDPAALKTVVQTRRREYERNRRLEPPPFLGAPPAGPVKTADEAPDAEAAAEVQPPDAASGAGEVQPPVQASLSAGRVYQGEGIAAGKARGTAYLVADLETMTYLDGLTGEHILVCTRDNLNAQWRRDWYALFMVVRGLVMVGGAQLHHASQMARECGVPFINMPAGALDDLPAGCQVEIDGLAGTLTLV